MPPTLSKTQCTTKCETFSSADVLASSDLEDKQRLVYSAFIGDEVILRRDATLVADFLQVADRCFALQPRYLRTAQS